MASVDMALVYVVRTSAGWRPWYVSYPVFGTGGMVTG